MFTAARMALIVGTIVGSGAVVSLPEPAPLVATPAPSPAFSFGAGDALGVRIRASDLVLARRLEQERVRHAAVEADAGSNGP